MRETVLQIKKRLRLSMNGAVSSSMRAKGMDYKVNFGVSVPTLRTIAASFAPSRELAWALFAETNRECKLLATMLYPIDEQTADDVERLLNECATTELTDLCVQHIFRLLPDASQLVARLLAEDAPRRYAGIQLLTRLVGAGQLSEREITPLLPPLLSVLENPNDPISIRAALNCIEKCLSTYHTLVDLITTEAQKHPLQPSIDEEFHSITGYFTLLK